MLPNSSVIVDPHNNHRHHPSSILTNDREDKVKRYMNYCKNLQLASGSSSNSLSSSKSGFNPQFQQSYTKTKNFLLDTWLENKLQASFKQLNYILQHQNYQQNYHHQIDADKDFEIFFLHQQDRSLNEWNEKSTLNSTEQNQVAIDLTSNDYVGLCKKIDDAPNRIYHYPTLPPTDDLIYCKDDKNKPLRTSGSHQSNLINQNENDRFDDRPLQIEQELLERLKKIIYSDRRPPPIMTPTLNNLYCLVLTHPSNKLKRDSLIYSYPKLDEHNKLSTIYKLSTLSGMFVTLFDVMTKLRTSTANDILSTSNIQFVSENGDDITKEYRISFVIENDDEEIISKNKRTKSIPLLLLIALPSDFFNEIDACNIVEILYHSLQICFGSLSSVFHQFFSTNSTSIFNYLDKILSTLNLLLTPRDKMDFIGSSLSFSNTYPISVTTTTNGATSSLVLQNLILDESIIFNLCKYLNDYDSLDWIDESIQFYKDGNDIEQALSEHFARCLQFGSSTSSTGLTINQTANSKPMTSIQSSLFIDNNHIFDLLELELTFFSVIGSCLFYRGFFVKSHLSQIYLNAIHNILFIRGILTATKHQSYHLVYFTRFYQQQNNKNNRHEKMDQNIDSNTDLFLLIIGHGHFLQCSLLQVYRFDHFDYNNFASKYMHKKKMENQCLQLPSSFAFYVFIKESFRLFHYYLDQFSLSDQLENLFEMTKEQTRAPILSLFKSIFSETDSRWIDKLNPFNIIRSTLKRIDDNKEIKFSQINKLDNNKKRSNCSSTNIDIQIKSNQESDSIDSNADSLSNDSIFTQSTIDFASFNYDSIYRFNYDCIPESLICFLNIEQQIETFYGPIIGFEDPNANACERWLAMVTSDVCHQMDQIRNTLKSMSKLEMKRRHRKRTALEGQSNYDTNEYRLPTKTKTACTLKLFYDSNGNSILSTDVILKSKNFLSLEICVIGHCDIQYLKDLDQDSISSEFYACFQMNPTSLEISSNNRQRYTIGKFNFFPEFTSTNNNSDEHQQQERSRYYEMDKLDFFKAIFDELVQNVRMENR